MKGWTGRLLRVDLSARRAGAEEIPAGVLRAYLGGRGLGAHLLYASGRHRLDPLEPGAAFVVATGPLTGTRAPTASRTSCTALSPLTGTLFDANSGGFFGIRLKRAGYDALWLEGEADAPVVVVVDPDGVGFDPATDLWGRGNRAVRAALRDRYGPKAAVLTVGLAGETGSRLANVAHGERFFGRGGLGAVLGAKRVKALVVRGDGPVEVADPEGFGFVVGECRKWLAAHPITSRGLPEFGTAVLMNVVNAVGALPARNFRQSRFGRAEAVSGEALRQVTTGRKACPGCPIACGRRVSLDGREVQGPEFETLWSFGADLGLADLEAVIRLNLLCNDLGLDTISAGATLAAARELWEEGVLDRDPLEGGPEGVARLLEEMARAEGPGELLRHGSDHLARTLGRPGAAMTVKGMELPAYDPRGCQGQGLAYATSNRGGCHLRSYMVAPEILATPKRVDRFAWSGKAGLVIVQQNLNAAVDSLVLCRFTGFALSEGYYARLVRAATGWDLDGQELLTVGERIYTVERLANLDRGLGRDHDTLPRRLLDEPVPDGPSAGHTVRLEPMLDEYYRFRGWDEGGRPSPGKLARLGLGGPEAADV